MKIIAIANQKGGVAKTTTTANLGAALARSGKSVLHVDIDPQGDLSSGFGIDTDALEKSIYDVIMGEAALEDVLVSVEDNLTIAPANIDLSGAEAELLSLPGKDQRLKTSLDGALYDFILIDCPPSLGQLTLNALTAAQEVYIPLQTQFYALKGVRKLLQTVELVQKWSNPALRIAGVIPTMYDARRTLDKEVLEQIREFFGDKVFSPIRTNTQLAEAPMAGQDIFRYKPAAVGAEDYQRLAEEVVGRAA